MSLKVSDLDQQHPGSLPEQFRAAQAGLERIGQHDTRVDSHAKIDS